MNQETLATAIRNVLDDRDVNYTFDCEDPTVPMIRFKMRIGSRIRYVDVVIQIRETFYLVYATSPVGGDPKNIDELAKFVAMVNYNLIVGNFELDVRDGEIRYKTFVDAADLESLPESIIDRSVFFPLHMFDRFGDGLAAVALGFSDAASEMAKDAMRQSDGESGGDDDDDDDDDGNGDGDDDDDLLPFTIDGDDSPGDGDDDHGDGDDETT